MMNKKPSNFLYACGLVLSLSLFCVISMSGQTLPFDSMVNFKEDGAGDYSVVWPAKEREIPAYQFKDDTQLEKIVISEGVVSIGEYAFLGCKNLKEVVLPSTLKNIGEGAFRECTSLISLDIPRGVTKIPAYMCVWDSALQYVNLPSTVVDIGRGAFSFCKSLQEIKLPSRLKHIGPNAFNRCESLKEVVVPDSMEELESYAFAGCHALRKATLPANNKMLGELIFIECPNLREIVCLSPNPPVFDCDSPLFDWSEEDMYKKCKLTILPSSKSKYKKAIVWNLFFSE
ncbi:MAG: leucine-rich repeat domain-containing protein [Muribaculaceae bacterium]|nr:leucine-rich repeat domain-containing protein [Muribaculaceae bacterium]